MRYKDSGVDIKKGDVLSEYLYDCAKQTWLYKDKLRKVIVPYDDFSGIRYIDISQLPPDSVMNINFDGIGTKVEIAEMFENYWFLAHDLFAMVCDDAASIGAEPMLIGTILDVDKLSDIRMDGWSKALGDGYVSAAKEANVAIVNGEVAELGSRICGRSSSLNLNWGAACVWFARKSNLIDRSKISEGDYLVGLQETGFRSNGFSLIRKIMNTNLNESVKNLRIFHLTLEPSRIYTRAIVEMTGGFYGTSKAKIHGIAHITGGGLYGKVKRMLKTCGLSAEINEPFEPPAIMKQIQRIGKVNDKEAYRTWNMGHGIVIITPEPSKVMKIALKHGHNFKIIGRIIKDDTFYIRNLGSFARTNFLEFRDA